MNIVFIWTGITSYMADCWRELMNRPDTRLKIVIEERRIGKQTAFDPRVILHGLDVMVRDDDEPLDVGFWHRMMDAFQPDIFFIVGWHASTSRFFAEDTAWRDIPKVLIFDLPFAWTFRKLFAPIVLHRYLRRFAEAFVPGVCAARYARWLGFRDGAIQKGLFSAQQPEPLPGINHRTKGFLYVGRYAPEKRLDVLVKAYRLYRSRVKNPWTLTCCGMGPERHWIEGVEGVSDLGFLQPEEIRNLYATHRAFVLASAFDPWPLVVLEAVSEGMPVICTDACGSVSELVKEDVNGLVCPKNNVNALADAMVWMHNHPDSIEKMGREGVPLTAPYTCEAWATRTQEMSKRIGARR